MYIPKNNSNTIYHTHLPMYQTNHATTKKKNAPPLSAGQHRPSEPTLHASPKTQNLQTIIAARIDSSDGPNLRTLQLHNTWRINARASALYPLSGLSDCAVFPGLIPRSSSLPLSLSLSHTHTETRLRCAKIAPLQIALLCSLRKRRLRDTVTSRRHRRAREKSPSPIVSGPRVDGFSERRKQGAVVSRWGLEGANPGPEQKELAPAYITQ